MNQSIPNRNEKPRFFIAFLAASVPVVKWIIFSLYTVASAGGVRTWAAESDYSPFGTEHVITGTGVSLIYTDNRCYL